MPRGGGSGWRWPRPSGNWGWPISQAQIDELKAHIDDIDFAAAAKYERKFRHDVMAHVHAYGDVCPDGPADHPSGRDKLLRHRQHRSAADAAGTGTAARPSWCAVIDRLATFAAAVSATCRAWASRICSRRSPRPSASGRRLWCYDLVLDLAELEHRLAMLKLRGSQRDDRHAGELSRAVPTATMPRSRNSNAESAKRWASTRLRRHRADVFPKDRFADPGRALRHGPIGPQSRDRPPAAANRKEIEEPFEAEQIGSSAMAYKRNPMRSRADVRPGPVRDEPAKLRRADGRRAMDGANARRQRQPPADAPAGVPGGRRRADSVPEHRERAGRLSAR